MSQLESGCHQRAVGRHYTARHQIGDANEAILPQRHDITESGPVFAVWTSSWGQRKRSVGRTFVDRALQPCAQVRILAQVVGEETISGPPAKACALAVHQLGAIDLPLSAAAKELPRLRK